FKVHLENALGSPDVTLDVNGVGAKPLRKEDNDPLDAGDLREDQIVSVLYDSSGGGRFCLLGATGSGSLSGTLNVDQGGTGSDLSASGGSGVVLKQKTVGGNLVAEALVAADIPDIDISQVEGLQEELDRTVRLISSAPSYLSPLSSGERRTLITATSNHSSLSGPVSNLLNGTSSNDFYWNSVAIAGTYVRFDFKAPVLLTEAKWLQSTASTHGNWQWQGSQDASTWTNIGSTFLLGGSTSQTLTTLSANTTEYRFYQLVGVSGTCSSSAYLYEVQFKISAKSVAEGLASVPLGGADEFARGNGSLSFLNAADMPANLRLILPKTASQTVNSGNTDKLTYNFASTNDGAFTVYSSVLTTVVAGQYLFEIPCFVSGGTDPYHILIAVNNTVVYKSPPATTIGHAVKTLTLAAGNTVEFRLNATTANCLLDTTDGYMSTAVVTRLN
ncbi:MAG: hypothetical protein KF760_34105, partial [Candidatus Eremiobacteraeota bacterium]|nr:hypothetical protein [Candidatus Eremiobacteraeota bacterium]MCW5871074.1 hypothetical protein [Candidatus Eremiobacteraeota bacterium]